MLLLAALLRHTFLKGYHRTYWYLYKDVDKKMFIQTQIDNWNKQIVKVLSR
jgi:hypothetical protein